MLRDMNWQKRIIAFFVVVIALMALYMVVTLIVAKPEKDPTLDTILKFSAIRNNSTDVLDDIGIKSSADVGFEVRGQKVVFSYGKHEFYVMKKYITTEDMKKTLNRLHISVLERKDGTYLCKYRDEKMQEWSTSDTYGKNNKEIEDTN